MSVTPTGPNPDALVLDAWALLTFFLGQPEAPHIRDVLRHAVHAEMTLYASTVNVGEAFS